MSAQDINYRFRTSWSMGDIFLNILLWIVLLVITLGIASFFAPYAWGAKFLNGTQVHDSKNNVLGVLKVDLRISEQIGHIFKWILLSIVTLGIAIPFYHFGVIRTVINRTEIVDQFETR